MSSPFTALHHICIVVHDLDQSIAHYSALGIGPWIDYGPLADYTTLSVPNAAAFMQARIVVANLDNVQLQLYQPSALDSPQRRFLDERGEGVFHLGFEADVDAAEDAEETSGLEVLMRGRRDDGSGFTYFDTQQHAGVTLCVRRSPR